MAEYGAGAFARPETAYRDPWEYRGEMGRMAGEKAGYLSEMDQFYGQLEFEKEKEATREKEWLKRLAFEEESQEEAYQLALSEFGFKEEEAEFMRGLTGEKWGLEEAMGTQEMYKQWLLDPALRYSGYTPSGVTMGREWISGVGFRDMPTFQSR